MAKIISNLARCSPPGFVALGEVAGGLLSWSQGIWGGGHSALNHGFFSAPPSAFPPCGYLGGFGKLESPLHLRSKRKSLYVPSPCKYSPPPFKTCACVFVLLCFKATADTEQAPACFPPWCAGLGLRGSGESGGPAASPCWQGCCGQAGSRPCPGLPDTAPAKALQKEHGMGIALRDSPSPAIPLEG